MAEEGGDNTQDWNYVAARMSQSFRKQVPEKTKSGGTNRKQWASVGKRQTVLGCIDINNNQSRRKRDQKKRKVFLRLTTT